MNYHGLENQIAELETATGDLIGFHEERGTWFCVQMHFIDDTNDWREVECTSGISPRQAAVRLEEKIRKLETETTS